MNRLISPNAAVIVSTAALLAYAETVHVAVAANLTAPMKAIAAEFERPPASARHAATCC